jgi:hypothetical protein
MRNGVEHKWPMILCFQDGCLSEGGQDRVGQDVPRRRTLLRCLCRFRRGFSDIDVKSYSAVGWCMVPNDAGGRSGATAQNKHSISSGRAHKLSGWRNLRSNGRTRRNRNGIEQLKSVRLGFFPEPDGADRRPNSPPHPSGTCCIEAPNAFRRRPPSFAAKQLGHTRPSMLCAIA